jgi:FkbM family methyltransferase
MSHRYLQPIWWIRRISGPAGRIAPAPFVMSVLARAERLGGEPELRLLEKIVPRDRMAVDIGAAEGVYTWHLRRIASGVAAFEPNPESAARLRARLPSVDVHAVAVSDRDGEALLRIPVTQSIALSGLGTVEDANDFQHGYSETHRIEVPARTLDSFSLPPLGFMKIDVEGHELAVLRGAERSIIRDRPTILIEVEDRHRAGAVVTVTSWLAARGYGPPSTCGSPQNLLFPSCRSSQS